MRQMSEGGEELTMYEDYIKRSDALKVLEEMESIEDGFKKMYKIQSAKCTGYVDPCDVCAYNPPSSMDGKPCSLCPARGKMEG